ncbi:uncharacterized protein LOC131228497 isoform X2 [Magnolia sinica]|uniref:uncharacterized protein LOC131228497 isoform X2 n=1 Tax=Magnolia sinica TaxID=86752 RepID=UPI00265807FC|nr:uncharacterized protein LOC131228497 isoform X2 [Magnolia sinica]
MTSTSMKMQPVDEREVVARMECAARGRTATACTGPATRRCGVCGAVAYCSRSHQISHWNDHKGECARFEKQMRCADALHDFPFTFSGDTTLQVTRCSFLTTRGLHRIGLWKYECSCCPSVSSSDCLRINDDWNLPSDLCPCTEPINSVSMRLSSWKDYYQWRCLPLNSPVALLLHWPLTIYQGVQLASSIRPISEIRSKLHIHYLGPVKELLQLAVFGELHALFPGLQVHIELVGPEVPQIRDGERINLYNYAHCVDADCTCKSAGENANWRVSNGRTSLVALQLWSGFYHDRCQEIVKELIQKMGVPAIFSDYCEEAAHLAARCITSVTGCPLTIPVQLNPYRQPMAVEDSALYLPCYSNCFLFGM